MLSNCYKLFWKILIYFDTSLTCGWLTFPFGSWFENVDWQLAHMWHYFLLLLLGLLDALLDLNNLLNSPHPNPITKRAPMDTRSK